MKIDVNSSPLHSLFEREAKSEYLQVPGADSEQSAIGSRALLGPSEVNQ